MIDDDDEECGAVGGIRIGRGNRSTRGNPAPVPIYPLQIKSTNFTVLKLVYYEHLLPVSIQLDHHQAVFMKCTIRVELFLMWDPYYGH
jgi:hypothetical protein